MMNVPARASLPPERDFSLVEICCSWRQPVFKTQPRHTSELSQVIRDDCQAFAARMTSNHHIVNPNTLARSLEFRPELAVMGSSPLRKTQNFQTRTKLLDDGQVLVRPGRFFRAIDKFSQCNNGNAKLIRKLIEPLA
jgi:hypothetical protein